MKLLLAAVFLWTSCGGAAYAGPFSPRNNGTPLGSGRSGPPAASRPGSPDTKKTNLALPHAVAAGNASALNFLHTVPAPAGHDARLSFNSLAARSASAADMSPQAVQSAPLANLRAQGMMAFEGAETPGPGAVPVAGAASAGPAGGNSLRPPSSNNRNSQRRTLEKSAPANNSFKLQLRGISFLVALAAPFLFFKGLLGWAVLAGFTGMLGIRLLAVKTPLLDVSHKPLRAEEEYEPAEPGHNVFGNAGKGLPATETLIVEKKKSLERPSYWHLPMAAFWFIKDAFAGVFSGSDTEPSPKSTLGKAKPIGTYPWPNRPAASSPAAQTAKASAPSARTPRQKDLDDKAAKKIQKSYVETSAIAKASTEQKFLWAAVGSAAFALLFPLFAATLGLENFLGPTTLTWLPRAVLFLGLGIPAAKVIADLWPTWKSKTDDFGPFNKILVSLAASTVLALMIAAAVLTPVAIPFKIFVALGIGIGASAAFIPAFQEWYKAAQKAKAAAKRSALRVSWFKSRSDLALLLSAALGGVGLGGVAIYFNLPTPPKAAEVKEEIVTEIVDISAYLPPGKKAQGGGGGGTRDDTPASQGKLPEKSLKPQIVKPQARILNTKPLIAIKPTIQVNPDIPIPDIPNAPNYGDPNALAGLPLSNGPGSGGGIGSGSGGGVGPGTGPGVGPGNGGNYGGGNANWQAGSGFEPPEFLMERAIRKTHAALSARWQQTVRIRVEVAPNGMEATTAVSVEIIGIVGPDGKTIIAKSVPHDMGPEILRVAKLQKAWKPGKKDVNGTRVPAYKFYYDVEFGQHNLN